MSKYDALWEYVQKTGKESFRLTFEEIQDIAGIPIDHSFLKYKKELTDYGYQVGKISSKVVFSASNPLKNLEIIKWVFLTGIERNVIIFM